MNGTTLLLALIGHLVGDYLLQNDWMALNKKKSSIFYKPFWGNQEWRWKVTTCFRWISFPCFVHCAIWTACVVGFAGWPVMSEHCGGWVLTWSLPVVVLFVTHFIQDRTNIIAWWMDAIGQKQFRTGPCAPWSLIAVDNIFHILTIVAIWKWIA